MTDTEFDDLDPDGSDPELESAAAALAAEDDGEDGDGYEVEDEGSDGLSDDDERILARAHVTKEMREKLSREEIRTLIGHHGKNQRDVDQKLDELNRLKNPQAQNGTATPPAAPSTASLREPVDAVLKAWPEQDLLDPAQRKQLRRGLEAFGQKVAEQATAQFMPLLDELVTDRLQGRLQERFPKLADEQRVAVQERAMRLLQTDRNLGEGRYLGLKGMEQALFDAADYVAPSARQEAVTNRPRRRSGQPAEPGRRTTTRPSQDEQEDRLLERIMQEEGLS